MILKSHKLTTSACSERRQWKHDENGNEKSDTWNSCINPEALWQRLLRERSFEMSAESETLYLYVNIYMKLCRTIHNNERKLKWLISASWHDTWRKRTWSILPHCLQYFRRKLKRKFSNVFFCSIALWLRSTLLNAKLFAKSITQ